MEGLDLLVIATLWVAIFSCYEAKRNKLYSIPGRKCSAFGDHDVDGAVLQSQPDTLYPICVISFEADDSSLFNKKKLQVKVEKWTANNCNIRMHIYRGSSDLSSRLVKTLDCRTSPGEVIYINNDDVTFRLEKPLSAHYTEYQFKLVITALESGYCNEFKCGNGKCIERDLLCDTVDHCFDGSDETANACERIPIIKHDVSLVEEKSVRKKVFGGVFRLGVGLIVGIAIAVIVICVLCCVVIVCCFQKRRGRRGYVRTPQTSTPGVTVTTTVPPSGSYPAQQQAYPMGPMPPAQPQYPPQPQPQPGYAAPPPAYPAGPTPPPQAPPAQTYNYGQGAGYTESQTQQAAPPGYKEASAPPAN